MKLLKHLAERFRAWRWERDAQAAGIPTLAEFYTGQGK